MCTAETVRQQEGPEEASSPAQGHGRTSPLGVLALSSPCVGCAREQGPFSGTGSRALCGSWCS